MSHPTLYQINTRALLRELSEARGRAATLDDIPSTALDSWKELGFDWVWMLGIWQTGQAGRAVSRTNPEWRDEFCRVLPDLTEADITGSPYAVQAYTVHADFGGAAALARLRERMAHRELKLLLDFVPNHTAPDHRWVREHPEFYISGKSDDLAREPQNYCRVETPAGPRIFAYGRDPYFAGWPDTLQLNYRSAALREAMQQELLQIGRQCDGLRCDMAMLLLPEVIERTWGSRAKPVDSAPVETPFWPQAIARVRTAFPGFTFMAEVYWDLEWTLQQQGFDFTYDKRLYDRLHQLDAPGVVGHLHADQEFQRRSARFLENHDEPRAAAAFARNVHCAAAVISFFVPGLRFFHEGQLEGRTIRLPMHLGRRPAEPVDSGLQDFYRRLLAILRRSEVHQGLWRLIDARPAWEGNPTWDRFVLSEWRTLDGQRTWVTVNYGPTEGQCVMPLKDDSLRGRTWRLRDLMSSATYDRDGDDLATNGMYLDLPAWGYHVFEVS